MTYVTAPGCEKTDEDAAACVAHHLFERDGGELDDRRAEARTVLFDEGDEVCRASLVDVFCLDEPLPAGDPLHRWEAAHIELLPEAGILVRIDLRDHDVIILRVLLPELCELGRERLALQRSSEQIIERPFLLVGRFGKVTFKEGNKALRTCPHQGA